MGNSPTYIPLPSLERWYEDRLVDLELSEDEVLAAFEPYKLKKTGLTNILRHPERATFGHLQAFETVLKLDNAYKTLVEGFGFGVAKCTLKDITEFVGRDGYSIGLVQHVA